MQLWDIEQQDLYALKGRFQRDRQGHEVWVLSMKRAWTWLEGRWVEEEAPAIINDDPIYAGDAGFSAMISDHDFPIHKKNTDVLVYGKAKTYTKKPMSSHTCRLLIDEHIDKSLIIIGERQWIDHSGSLTVSSAKPFIEREIDYTNAIGGDERNRLGSGIADTNEELASMKVPSVFYVGQNWQANSNKVQVAGFGPLPPFFSERSRWAGTFDERWQEERRPLWPIDFDDRFYQSAPHDQQCKGYLIGGERLMVSGFCHDDALSFRIPTEKYQATVTFQDKEEISLMPIYTVWIDANKKRVEVIYTASFHCQDREHLLTSSRLEEVSS
ncbi:DUF2169 family type VI secretion system accessory protein [Aliivibrio sifiae]|uniref:DUF2169 domain-containing protein n=1 Tax=Aliivibrio sifiae TaxID=566293 RepID=A0A2S7X2Z3_9GAMM|nr:DUF2169 domain-containing protein [Aliivibrio sifiae]PQJ84379.1 hypothetical protein BTO22_12620 [Aliivibrio sifiae]